MSRSTWKGSFVCLNLFKEKFKQQKRKLIWTRNSTIPENLIGQSVFVHNGQEFIKIFITREKVGFKFGDFAMTRKFTKKILKSKIKNKKEKKPKVVNKKK